MTRIVTFSSSEFFAVPVNLVILVWRSVHNCTKLGSKFPCGDIHLQSMKISCIKNMSLCTYNILARMHKSQTICGGNTWNVLLFQVSCTRIWHQWMLLHCQWIFTAITLTQHNKQVTLCWKGLSQHWWNFHSQDTNLTVDTINRELDIHGACYGESMIILTPGHPGWVRRGGFLFL
jgi:hypothetical protein